MIFATGVAKGQDQPDQIRFNLSDQILDFNPIMEDSTVGIKPSLPNFAFGIATELIPLKGHITSVPSVKDQGSRAVCTVFTTLDTLQALLSNVYQVYYEFSQQYLQYTISTQLQFAHQELSNIADNVTALKRYGVISESLWNYNSESWITSTLSPQATQAAKRTCDWVTEDKAKKACLIGQGNPHQWLYSSSAEHLKGVLDLSVLRLHHFSRTSEIKTQINRGIPVIVDLPVFFKAWNHPWMTSVGLGPMNVDAFKKGIIENPTAEDIEASKKRYGSHSVLIVGYNDVTRQYTIKNSWGTDYWGSDFVDPEQGKLPGYGSLPYHYANTYGTFTSIDYGQ